MISLFLPDKCPKAELYETKSCLKSAESSKKAEDTASFGCQKPNEPRGNENNADVPPAVEAVQKAHFFFFVVRRYGFDKRTYRNFQNAASDRHSKGRNRNSTKGVRKNERKNCQRHEADRRKTCAATQMRRYPNFLRR